MYLLFSFIILAEITCLTYFFQVGNEHLEKSAINYSDETTGNSYCWQPSGENHLFILLLQVQYFLGYLCSHYISSFV